MPRRGKRKARLHQKFLAVLLSLRAKEARPKGQAKGAPQVPQGPAAQRVCGTKQIWEVLAFSGRFDVDMPRRALRVEP
eukprot:5375457-Pyramimonas_sp.AAC.1